MSGPFHDDNENDCYLVSSLVILEYHDGLDKYLQYDTLKLESGKQNFAHFGSAL